MSRFARPSHGLQIQEISALKALFRIRCSLLPCGMGLTFQSIRMAFFITTITFSAAFAGSKFRDEPNLQRHFDEACVKYKRKSPFLFPRRRHLPGSVTIGLRGETGLTPWIFIAICVTGLALLTLLTYSSRSVMFPWQKQAAGLLFSVICVFGMVAGVWPRLCSGAAHFKTVQKVNFREKGLSKHQGSSLKGHHPDCSGFASHVLRFDGRAYCAGCMGLVTGAVMSVAGSLFYFSMSLDFEGLGAASFWSGLVGVLLGVFQYNLHVDRASVHFLLNVLFVFGAFLLLVGVSEISRDFALQLYFTALAVFWIFARVMLSQLEHIKICAKCKVHTCRASNEAV